MSPTAAAQLAFAAEFATFLVAVAGLAAAVRPGVLSRTGWSRSALATGFLGLAVTSFFVLPVTRPPLARRGVATR